MESERGENTNTRKSPEIYQPPKEQKLVYDLFNEQIKDSEEMELENQDMQYLYQERLKEMRDKLAMFISQFDRAPQKVNLSQSSLDVAPALSELSNNMMNAEFSASTYTDQDPEKAEWLKKNRDARKVLQQTFKILYEDLTREKIPESYFSVEGSDHFVLRVKRELLTINKRLERLKFDIHIDVPGLEEGLRTIKEGRSLVDLVQKDISKQNLELALDIVTANMKNLADHSHDRNWMEFNVSVIKDDDIPLSEGGRKQLDSGNSIFYELMLLRDALVKKIYGREDMPPDDQERIKQLKKEVRNNKQNESGKEEEPSDEKLLERLKDPSIRTIEEIKRVVTSEVKEAFLRSLLVDLDDKIAVAEKINKEDGATLNVKKMASNFGLIQFKPGFQRIVIATEGKFVDAKSVELMPVVDYLKKYLNYDLEQDPQRAEALKKYTNMFWK